MWLLIKSITYLFTIYLYSMSAQYLCWKCILAPANQSASQPSNQPLHSGSLGTDSQLCNHGINPAHKWHATLAWSVKMLREFLTGVGIDRRSSFISVFQFHVRRLVELAKIRSTTSRTGTGFLHWTIRQDTLNICSVNSWLSLSHKTN